MSGHGDYKPRPSSRRDRDVLRPSNFFLLHTLTSHQQQTLRGPQPHSTGRWRSREGVHRQGIWELTSGLSLGVAGGAGRSYGCLPQAWLGVVRDLWRIAEEGGL